MNDNCDALYLTLKCVICLSRLLSTHVASSGAPRGQYNSICITTKSYSIIYTKIC